jgi:hypothetical protein
MAYLGADNPTARHPSSSGSLTPAAGCGRPQRSIHLSRFGTRRGIAQRGASEIAKARMIGRASVYRVLEAGWCGDIVRRGTRASASGGVFPIPSFQTINPKKIAAGANAAINPIVTKHIVASSEDPSENKVPKGRPGFNQPFLTCHEHRSPRTSVATDAGQSTSSPGVPVTRSAGIVSGLDRYGSRIPRIGLCQLGDEREGDEA